MGGDGNFLPARRNSSITGGLLFKVGHTQNAHRKKIEQDWRCALLAGATCRVFLRPGAHAQVLWGCAEICLRRSCSEVSKVRSNGVEVMVASLEDPLGAQGSEARV